MQLEQTRGCQAQYLGIVLISHAPNPTHDAERRARARGSDVDHFYLQSQLIAGPHGT
jgi:hypothetical protein